MHDHFFTDEPEEFVLNLVRGESARAVRVLNRATYMYDDNDPCYAFFMYCASEKAASGTFMKSAYEEMSLIRVIRELEYESRYFATDPRNTVSAALDVADLSSFKWLEGLEIWKIAYLIKKIVMKVRPALASVISDLLSDAFACDHEKICIYFEQTANDQECSSAKAVYDTAATGVFKDRIDALPENKKLLARLALTCLSRSPSGMEADLAYFQ